MPRKKKGNRFNPQKDTCYVCSAPATSDEHVPPKAFFPPSYSTAKLVTVPSCATHNNDHAKDVEYVRNVICIMYGTNAAAEEVAEVAKRSWDKSDKLFYRTFRDVKRAEVDGEGEVAVFKIDLLRVKTVVNAIAHALYYLETSTPAPGDFDVFCGFHSEKSLRGKRDDTEELGRTLAGAKYEDRPTPHPEVFQYKVHDGKYVVIFAMGFYEAVWCYAWGAGASVVP
jgi:hypothetical protein